MKAVFTVLSFLLLSFFAQNILAQTKNKTTGTLGNLATLKISEGNGDAAILDLEEDKSGNWCVIGFFMDTLRVDKKTFVGMRINPSFASYKYFYAKYKNNGELLWLKEYPIQAKKQHISAEKIETDANNNIYVLGLYKGTADFGGKTLTNETEESKEFLAKYDKNGILQWVKGFERGFYSESRDFVTDATGNSYLLSYPAQVTKIDTKGNEIFKENMPNGFTAGAIALWKDRIIIGTSISADYEIGINFKDNTTVKLEGVKAQKDYFYNKDAFIASLDNNSGKIIWAQMIRSNQSEEIKGLGVDNEGNISVLGTCAADATFGLKDPKKLPISATEKGYNNLSFILNLASNGNLRWFKSLPIEENRKQGNYAVSLKVDNDGNTFSTRTHCNESLFWAVYIESFDKNGNNNFYKTLGLGENKKNSGFWKSHCGTANVFVHLSKYTNRKYIFGEGKYFRNKNLDFFNNLTVEETPYKNTTRYFIAQYGDGTALANNSITDNPITDNPIIDPIIDNPVIDNPVTEPVVVINPNTNNNTVSFVGIPSGNETVTPQNLAFEKEVLRLTNVERAKEGLSALVWNENLTRAARYHAADMAKDGYFDHNTHDKVNGKLVKICTTFERITKFGSGSGENIASGGSTPAATVLQWMNSPGHKENIMRKFTTLGVGFYDGIWVQVFGY